MLQFFLQLPILGLHNVHAGKSSETYLEFNLYATKHTFTAARMLHCKIQLQQTHFLFKQALVVISRTI